MDKETEIVLQAIITNVARQEGGAQFLQGFSQSLFGAVEDQLVDDPVTIREVKKFTDLANNLRGRIST